MRILLRWKILILAVLTPLALGLGALALVDHRVSSNIRSTVNESLRRSALVSEQIMEARARSLVSSARVVSQDPRFLSVMALASSARDRQSRATLNDVALGLNHIAQADLFEVFDTRGRLVSTLGADASDAPQRQALLTRAASEGTATGIMVHKGVVLQVAAVRAELGGRRIGTLCLGLRMGDRLAGELGALTRSEVSFVADDVAAAPAPGDVSQVQVGGKGYLSLSRSVPDADAEAPAHYILRRSLDEEMGFLSVIQRELLELGFIILIAATALGIMVSLTITRPVSALVRAAEEMERGNYETPIDVNTKDEIGYLAERFREMRQHERGYVATLEEVARLKSDFISVASHELRTPATLIKAYGDIILDGNLGPVTDEQRRAIGVIQQSVNVIVRITDDATSMASVQGERPTLSKDDFAAAILIREAVAAAAAEGPQRKVQITESIDDLGVVRVDGKRIREAITHLVRNAIRFTPDGGSVEVSARRDGAELRVDVRDTGVGIPQEKQAHLFTRSFMLRDARKHHSSSELEFNSAGLGLGLPIARGIAQAHGGSITVTSAVGEGSTFTFRIPVAPAGDALAAA